MTRGPANYWRYLLLEAVHGTQILSFLNCDLLLGT
jgi:hypothetical protein